MRHLAAVVSSVFVVLLGAASVAEARPPACTTCPGGEYCDLANTGLCQPCSTCSPGTFESVACGANTDTVCSSCPANCVDCADGSTCNQCDVGYWFDPDLLGGNPACVACSAPCGTGEVEVQTCNLAHDRVCAAMCSAGTFDNNGVCDACGVTNCAQCSAASGCDACADGYYFDVTNGACVACTTCATGQRIDVACGADHDATCVDCTAGTYSDSPGSATCTMCEAGKYQPDAGQTSCIACPTGETSGMGQTHCDCAAGSAGTTGMCSQCPAGKFAMSAGSATCMDCMAGTYSAAGSVSCTACAAGSSSAAGAASCTPCAAGTFAASAGSSECTQCPAGETSETGATGCSAPPDVCGDGTLAASEACDDGNPDDGDGCSSACAVEDGWTCAVEPDVTESVCTESDTKRNGSICQASPYAGSPVPWAMLPLAFLVLAWRRRRVD